MDRRSLHQQPAAAELNPAVPAELSALIDKLLAKERDRRPRDAGEVAERLATLAAQISRGGTTLTPHADPRLDQPTVGVDGGRGATAQRRLRRWLAVAALSLLGLRGEALPDNGAGPLRLRRDF